MGNIIGFGKVMKLEPNLANMLSVDRVFTFFSVKSIIKDFTLKVRFAQFL